MTKYAVKDIEKALAFFKSKGAVNVQLKIDDNFRLQMTMAVDNNGNGTSVTIYATDKQDEPMKMPEVTETRRL